MTYLVAYVAVFFVFGIIDATWLITMGKTLYRPTLGDLLLEDFRIAPAVIFYLAYPIGMVVFAVMPGLRSDSLLVAFLSALLFGAIAYGTYDLTNYATLRNASRAASFARSPFSIRSRSMFSPIRSASWRQRPGSRPRASRQPRNEKG
jgi:uncharacterized membrane protein